MEKPKNYWLRAQIAIVGVILFPLFSNFVNSPLVLNPPYILFINLALGLIVFIASILSITQGIRFKDGKYIFFGILPLLIVLIELLFSSIILSHTLFID